MRTFYFTEQYKNAKFGTKVIQKIYKIGKDRRPILLTTHEYNTQSCMGEKSEVIQGLVLAGVIPKKYLGKYHLQTPFTIYQM